MSGTHTGFSVAIAFCRRPTTPWWAVCLSTMDWPGAIDINYRVVEGREIGDARNMMVEQALAANDKYIWFLDDDTGPPRWAAKRLMSTLEKNPEVSAVAGIYCTVRTETPEPMVLRQLRSGYSWDWKPGDVFEAEGVGGGCLMVRTEVFRKIEGPWFVTRDDYDAETDTGVSGTDDLYFCQKLKDAGLKMLAHGGVLCWHYYVKEDIYAGIPEGSPDCSPIRTRNLADLAGKRMTVRQAA